MTAMGTMGKRQQPGEPRPEPRLAKPNGDTNRSLREIELALANEFAWKRNIIAFNVQGLSGRLNIQHECDMLVLTKAGYLTEIEIKRSWSDFCADFRKRHHHESHGPDIKEFWFCIPAGLFERCLDKLTEEKVLPTGLLCYDEDLNFRYRHTVAAYNDADLERALKGGPRDPSRRCVLGFRSEDQDHDVKVLYARFANPLFIEQRLELARLGALRQVTLREEILRLTEREPAAMPETQAVARLETQLVERDILLGEYRRRFREEVGYDIDEKEVLYG